MTSWKSDIESIGHVAHLLVRDRIVVKAFKSAYGPDALYFLRALRRRNWHVVEGADRDVRDVLADALVNDARLYARFLGRGPEEDRYHIDVRGLGGVYFVQPSEFGDSELFGSLNAAESWILDNWNDNLVSGIGRRYREPFSVGSRDSGDPLPRLSRAQLVAAKHRLQERQAEAKRAAAGPATLRSICSVDVVDDLFAIGCELLLDCETSPTHGFRLWTRAGQNTEATAITCAPDVDIRTAAGRLIQDYIRWQGAKYLSGWKGGEVLTDDDLAELIRATDSR